MSGQREAYNAGDLRVGDKCPTPDDSGSCNCDEYHPDSLKGKAYLPHSCDQWIIGGVENLNALIADAQKAIKELEKR